MNIYIGTKFKDFCIVYISNFKSIYDNNVILSYHDYNINEQCSPFDVNENKCKTCKVGYALAFNDENTQKYR